jgi:hypothetical protein
MNKAMLARDIYHYTERLLCEGYCVIPDLMPETVEALDRDLAPPSSRRPSARAASTASGRKGSDGCSPAPTMRRAW